MMRKRRDVFGSLNPFEPGVDATAVGPTRPPRLRERARAVTAADGASLMGDPDQVEGVPTGAATTKAVGASAAILQRGGCWASATTGEKVVKGGVT